MAYLKILVRRKDLKECVDYAVNNKKTVIEKEINYAVNPDKTEATCFVSCLNCGSVETSYSEMQDTKKRYGKTDGVVCYHIIQSFLPEEGTPEQIHKIGIDFCRECFEDFEVVIGTHLDKAHLHNHIVVNSVSFIDGHKYRSTPKTYYELRDISDKLCKENDLSVIIPKGKGSHYAQWKAEHTNQPTIRGQIKKDIDEAIERAFTYNSFIEILKKSGYIIKSGNNIKHTAVKPEGSTRFFRLDTLGQGYTEEDIKKRLLEKQYSSSFKLPLKRHKKTVKARLKGRYGKSSKITGIRALYWRYLYLLGKVKKRTAPNKISHYLYEDVIKFNKYVKQNKFLQENHIETTQDLINMKSFFHTQKNNLVSQRKELYKELRKKNEKTKESEGYQELNRKIKDCRYKIRQCESILSSSERIQTLLQKSKENESEEALKHEYRKRSGRTNDKGNFENFRNRSEINRNRS